MSDDKIAAALSLLSAEAARPASQRMLQARQALSPAPATDVGQSDLSGFARNHLSILCREKLVSQAGKTIFCRFAEGKGLLSSNGKNLNKFLTTSF